MSKILIVDDECLSRETIKGYLIRKGYDVSTASDGEEALEKYGNDITVLTDVDMPRMDGFELLRGIREINPDAYVIVMSGNDENGKIIEYGASGFIKKPFNLENLERLLSDYKE